MRVVNSEKATVRVQVLHHLSAGVCRQQRVVFGPVEAKLFAPLVVGRHAKYGQILALKRAQNQKWKLATAPSKQKFRLLVNSSKFSFLL